jgi:hypothetical protein
MVTVSEVIDAKIKKRAQWQEANPGISWSNPEHSENEGKIFITKELLESSAYRSLSRVALLIYQDFLAKRRPKPIKRNKKTVWIFENNGDIIYPYLEAEEKGFSRVQFRDAIDELQNKGLIDITHHGRGGRRPQRGTGDVSTYWIDDRWKAWGTDEYRPPRKPRKKDKRKDRGWALYHWKKNIPYPF